MSGKKVGEFAHRANDPRNGNAPLQWESWAEVFDRDILLVHNALPFLPDLARAVEERLARDPDALHPCNVVQGEKEYEDATHRSSRRIILGLDPELRVYDVMCRAVEVGLLQRYRALVNPFAFTRYAGGYDLLRYGVGQFFNEHVDIVLGHPLLSQRRLAVVAFCNDDFEGGELRFTRHELTVRPEPGLLVMFPASFTHPHASLPITRGVKASCVTWFW